jgi:hypothetical protein
MVAPEPPRGAANGRQRLPIGLRSLGILVLLLARPLRAETSRGPEINPFACQGQAEVLEADRTIGETRAELAKRMDPLALPEDPATVRAIKLCVVAELKRRVGDADAITYYERAIEANPDEPGFEMFAGRYYGGARGAHAPVLELAEKHYYRALAKLDRLREQRRWRDYHDVVLDHVQKGLLVLYQQDGLPLSWWKAHPAHASGYLAPGLTVASQLSVSADTRDGPGANEVGDFSAEAGLYLIRAMLAGPPDRFPLFQIARNPLRIRSDTEVRLRHPYVGAIDFTYSLAHAENAFVGGSNAGFARPAEKNDIDVREIGAAYERVVPLYPAFDLRLAAAARRVHRVGVIEFRATCPQDFNVYVAQPSLSRFIGSDKLTIGGTYVLMDIPPVDCPGGPFPDDPLSARGRRIAAVNFEYAFYSPILLPSLDLLSLRPFRTPTRGLYLSAGYVNDNELFGDHRTISETFYAGARLEGPGPFDVGLTETFYDVNGTQLTRSGTGAIERPDDRLSGRSVRSSLVVARRLVNPDETPGMPGSWAGLAMHSLHWVFPLSWDKVVGGPREEFENVRIGTQLWWQLFGTGFGGPAFLLTASYDYQYFYRPQLRKNVHNVGLTLRMGWREL